MLIVEADSSDYNWEKRISTGIVEKAKATELFWLETVDDSFLALFNSQHSEEAKGAAIILHSIGGHADWPEVISPVRKILPQSGWSTLSIQLPTISPENNIENYGNTLQEAEQRIVAAVKLLRKRGGFSNIILIGHGFGALVSLAYLEKKNSQNVDAIIAISLQNYVYVKPAINVLRLIEKIKIPTLDIYGSLDFREGVESAPDRRLASKKSGNYLYTQIEVKGADHYFNNMENNLIQHIVGWMNKTILIDPTSSNAVSKPTQYVR
jgi:pimeloyl-ACP methyl ester carboxylesterase